MDNQTKENLMLAFLKDPDAFRHISLSKTQTKMVKFIIKKGSSTSKEIAHKFNVSIQHASTTLARLHTKGYLKRINVGDDTGGNEYKYFFFGHKL